MAWEAGSLCPSVPLSRVPGRRTVQAGRDQREVGWEEGGWLLASPTKVIAAKAPGPGAQAGGWRREPALEARGRQESLFKKDNVFWKKKKKGEVYIYKNLFTYKILKKVQGKKTQCERHAQIRRVCVCVCVRAPVQHVCGVHVHACACVYLSVSLCSGCVCALWCLCVYAVPMCVLVCVCLCSVCVPVWGVCACAECVYLCGVCMPVQCVCLCDVCMPVQCVCTCVVCACTCALCMPVQHVCVPVCDSCECTCSPQRVGRKLGF